MKVLHVIPSMNPTQGGPSQGIRNFEYGLRGKNIERHVVCFDDIEEVKLWSNSNLTIHALGKSKTRWGYNANFSSWFKSHVFDFDVVIINGLWLYHSYKTINIINKRLSKQKKNIKVYIMPHGMLDPWFQNTKTRRFKSIRNEIYWCLIERNVINSVDGLLFTCHEELRLARESFKGYCPKSEKNIGYGIEPPPIQTESMNATIKKLLTEYRENKYWLYFSRVNKKKGLDLLIDAYKKLLLENNTKDLPNLIIAGPGVDSRFGEQLLNIVNSSELLRAKVHFVGMLSGDAKWGAIYNCEVLILPSHQENFGIVVAEALACAKPVLISNQVNIWKEIKQFGAGLICEDNMDSVYNTLKEFIELKDDEKKTMSNNAYLTYKTFFDVKVTAQNLIEAIS